MKYIKNIAQTQMYIDKSAINIITSTMENNFEEKARVD
jgi:hypothetical protein